MTSSHHGPYVQGDTRATMAGTEGSEAVRRNGSEKEGQRRVQDFPKDIHVSRRVQKEHDKIPHTRDYLKEDHHKINYQQRPDSPALC